MNSLNQFGQVATQPINKISLSEKDMALVCAMLFASLPLTSILKALSGSRYVLLVLDFGFLLITFLMLIPRLTRGRLFFSGLDLLWLMLLALSIVQVFNPNIPSVQIGLEGFRKFMFMSISYYLGRHLLHWKALQKWEKWLLAVSVFVSLYGIKQFFWMSKIDWQMINLSTSSEVTYTMGGWVRPFATLPGPFHLGLYMVLAGLLSVKFIYQNRKRSTKLWLMYAVFFVQMVALIMTRTKGNWAGFAFGVVVLVSLLSRKPFVAVSRLLLLSGAVLLLLGSFVLFSNEQATKVIEDAIQAFSDPVNAPTMVIRGDLWTTSIIPAIINKPLLGYGTGSAGEGMRPLFENTNGQHFDSHNLYFKILLELGLPGFLLFTTLVFTSIHSGWKMLKNRTLPTEKRTFLRWAMATVIAFLLAGLVIPTLDAYPVNYYFWLLLGILSKRTGMII